MVGEDRAELEGERVERVRPLVPEDMDLPELALRFILAHPAISTTIPGMRRPASEADV